jgi:hypothetical protein
MQRRMIDQNPISPSHDDDAGGEAVSLLTILATVLFALLVVAVVYFSQMAMQ